MAYGYLLSMGRADMWCVVTRSVGRVRVYTYGYAALYDFKLFNGTPLLFPARHQIENFRI